MNARKIALWPDGVWCDLDDLEDYLNCGWSDDYVKIEVSWETEDEDIDNLVAKEIIRYGGLCK